MSDRFPFLPFIYDVLQRVEFIHSLITLSVGSAQIVHCFVHRIRGPKCQRKSALGSSTCEWEDNTIAEHLAGTSVYKASAPATSSSAQQWPCRCTNTAGVYQMRCCQQLCPKSCPSVPLGFISLDAFRKNRDNYEVRRPPATGMHQ